MAREVRMTLRFRNDPLSGVREIALGPGDTTSAGVFSLSVMSVTRNTGFFAELIMACLRSDFPLPGVRKGDEKCKELRLDGVLNCALLASNAFTTLLIPYFGL